MISLRTRVTQESSTNSISFDSSTYIICIVVVYIPKRQISVHDYASIQVRLQKRERNMVLKKRSARSRGHQQHFNPVPNQSGNQTKKQRNDISTSIHNSTIIENGNETHRDNLTLDNSSLNNYKIPTTIPHLLAFLNLLYISFFSNLVQLGTRIKEVVMGLTNWWIPRSGDQDGEEDGCERLEMIENSTQKDGSRQARRDSPDGKQIKRRRHQDNGPAGKLSYTE